MRPAALALSVVTAGLSLIGLAGVAHADQAVISVGPLEPAPVVRVYAPPPPYVQPAYVPPQQPARLVAADPDLGSPHELYRSPFRFQVTGTSVTTGRGMGPGLGFSVDFGRDEIGFRLAAAWTRGEPSSADSASPLSDGLAQYTAEFTYDFIHRGPLHPVFGLGFGLAHVNRGSGAGDVGIGTARFGLEYALPMSSADVRLAAGVTGVLPGPADTVVADVRTYALFSAGVGIGF